jgi:hypothetical protein
VEGERKIVCERERETHTPTQIHPHRELLRRKLENLHQLARVLSCILEAKGVKTDLTNHGIVGNHHRARPEECLQVVWELSTTSIARIHGDEGVGVDVERNVRAFEVEHERPLLSLFHLLLSDVDFKNLVDRIEV